MGSVAIPTGPGSAKDALIRWSEAQFSARFAGFYRTIVRQPCKRCLQAASSCMRFSTVFGVAAGPALLLSSAMPAQQASSTKAPDLMAAGISRQLADYRASRISDVRYDLSLDVTAHDTARGHVTIAFARSGTGDAIVDFRGPHLGTVILNGAALSPDLSNGMHIRLPAASLRRGENSVSMSFSALIAPAGASVIRYHDVTDGADYLYTLLVPSDANQLFPCFDQPDIKARTALTLTIPVKWNAVANGTVQRIDSSATTRTIHFTRTKPISTYLIAFAAGPWARVTRSVDGYPITMYVRASRANEADLDTLLALNQRALDWMEGYFGRAFPFEKFD